MDEAPEFCVRCGADTHGDARTLWMACFYAMDELPVPFKQAALRGIYCELDGYDPSPFLIKGLPRWKPAPDAKEHTRPFFTLRVCKDCRADWMAAIQAWFQTKPEREEDDDEGGIFVREMGATKRISAEEFVARKAAGAEAEPPKDGGA